MLLLMLKKTNKNLRFWNKFSLVMIEFLHSATSFFFLFCPVLVTGVRCEALLSVRPLEGASGSVDGSHQPGHAACTVILSSSLSARKAASTRSVGSGQTPDARSGGGGAHTCLRGGRVSVRRAPSDVPSGSASRLCQGYPPSETNREFLPAFFTFMFS